MGSGNVSRPDWNWRTYDGKEHTEVACLCLRYSLRMLIIADITGVLPSKLPVSKFLLTMQQTIQNCV